MDLRQPIRQISFLVIFFNLGIILRKKQKLYYGKRVVFFPDLCRIIIIQILFLIYRQ